MSNLHDQPIHDSDPPLSQSMITDSDTVHLPELTITQLSRFLSKMAFWSAITLPVIYFPLLVAGLDSTIDLLVFLSLFALHVISLVLGQTHLSD